VRIYGDSCRLSTNAIARHPITNARVPLLESDPDYSCKCQIACELERETGFEPASLSLGTFILGAGCRSPSDGQKVRYDAAEGRKGPGATSLQPQ
jgi:hypothetical protein